jgi:hypothetical protein
VPGSGGSPGESDSQFRAVGTGELAWAECHGRAAVVIEPVSANSLRETGVFRETSGDFPPFRPREWETGSLETKPNGEKARISRPFRRGLQTVAIRRTGWLGREGSNSKLPKSKRKPLPVGHPEIWLDIGAAFTAHGLSQWP